VGANARGDVDRAHKAGAVAHVTKGRIADDPCLRSTTQQGAERRKTAATIGAMLQVVAVWHVIVTASLVGLILMHSGRDAGMGGMGFTPASQGGTHIVERNLTRLTVVVGIIFFLDTIALFHLLK
jgi:preprotein translocase subunit SecG